MEHRTKRVYFKLKQEELGGHMHTRVFAGPDKDHLGLAGVLVMSFDEWHMFISAFKYGVDRFPTSDTTTLEIDVVDAFNTITRHFKEEE